MATTVEDLLKVNIVFVGAMLLKTQEQRSIFQQAIGTELLSNSFMIGQIGEGHESGGNILQIPKDRISLECSNFRSIINRDYPSYNSLARLSEVINHCVAASSSDMEPITSFGFNIALVFNQDSGHPAIKYISDRFLSSKFAGDDRPLFIGGSGKLIFQYPNYKSTYTLEPRRGDLQTQKVFLEINKHFEHDRYPSGESLLQELQSLWCGAHDFVNRIDTNVSH